MRFPGVLLEERVMLYYAIGAGAKGLYSYIPAPRTLRDAGPGAARTGRALERDRPSVPQSTRSRRPNPSPIPQLATSDQEKLCSAPAVCAVRTPRS